VDKLQYLLAMKGYPTKKGNREFDCLQSYTSEELLEWNTDAKWDIFKYHAAYTDWYRDFAGASGSSWENIPILRKSHLQKPLESLLSSEYLQKDIYRGSTSGSSGHPMQFAKDKLCHVLTWANIANLYRLHGISLNDKQARLYGIPKDSFGGFVERTKDLLMNRTRFPVFDLSDAVMDRWIKTFKRGRFVYIYGYTSSITLFSRYCIDRGIVLKDLCPTLKKCIVTSETCTLEDRLLITRAFGIGVVNEYGASETDVMAFEYPGGMMRVSLTNVFMEIVDVQGRPLPDGTEGRILVTSLHNKAMPIIRYEIGDVGIMGRDSNGLPFLEKLSGRINDVVHLPSGKTAAGLTFYYISRSILESGGRLREFIIRQTSLDTFEFEIVSDSDLLFSEIEAIKCQMERYLEPGLKLIVKRVPFIQRSPAGKLKHFHSEIKHT